ncbi:hypothetical protein BKA93DRAFT_102911 [Sparassis latifolia]
MLSVTNTSFLNPHHIKDISLGSCMPEHRQKKRFPEPLSEEEQLDAWQRKFSETASECLRCTRANNLSTCASHSMSLLSHQIRSSIPRRHIQTRAIQTSQFIPHPRGRLGKRSSPRILSSPFTTHTWMYGERFVCTDALNHICSCICGRNM